MMDKQKAQNMNKCLGAAGYLLNNYENAAKHTKFDKFAVKHKSKQLLNEVEKLENALTESNKSEPTYKNSMEQLNHAYNLYDTCMNASYKLGDKAEQFNQFVLDKYNELLSLQ